MRITSLALFASALTLAACSTAADQAESSPTASAGSTAGSSTGGGSTDVSGPGSESNGQTSTEAPSTGFPETTSGSSSATGTDSTTLPVTSSDTGTTGIDPSSSSSDGTTTEATGTTGTAGTTGTTGETTGSTEGSTEGTTGNMGGGPCEVDADCQLHDDCCDCYGVPLGMDDPICKLECDQTKCEEYGLDKAVCLNGQCTLEKVDCSSEVACDALPPACEEGFLPSIEGLCWTGKCVPAAACDQVPDCKLCPDSMMCVEYQEWEVHPTCLPIPAECGDKPNCACAGESSCIEPYDTCNEGVGEVDLWCACIAC